VNFPQLIAAQDHSDELRQLTWERFSRWRDDNGMSDHDDAALPRIMEENGSDEATADLDAMLDRIDPLYDRAMAIRASTIRGLAVKARAAAVLSYEPWGKSADEMRRSEQALRSLIEDICTMAGVSIAEVTDREIEA